MNRDQRRLKRANRRHAKKVEASSNYNHDHPDDSRGSDFIIPPNLRRPTTAELQQMDFPCPPELEQPKQS